MKAIKRLKEPSTWAAFGALGAVFGVKELAAFGIPEVATTFASVAALLAGIFLPERSRDDD